jgi:hypothetical protein
MNVYKVSFTYATNNGFLRNGALIIEAETPERAHEICTAQLAKDDGFRFPSITKAVLYGVQHELDVTTKQPKPKQHR